MADTITQPTSGIGRDLPSLTLREKTGYASGAVLDGVATQAINIFLFFYATAVCGLPAALVGISLAAGLVVDAISDPLIGSQSDSLQSRFGRRLPFMAIGVPGTIVFLALLFALPSGWSVPALFVWLTGASIGLRVSISFFLLPYNALGAELSDGYEERSSIAAWRWGLGMVSAMVTVALGFGAFLSGEEGLTDRGAYLPFALTLGMLIALGALVSMRAIHRMPHRQFQPVSKQGEVGFDLIRQIRELFANRSFVTLFSGALLLFASAAIHSTLGIHANKYFWGMVPAQIQIVTLALFAGLLCGAPLASPMLKRIEKRNVLIIGILGIGSAFAIPPSLRLLGILPATDAPPVALLASTIFLGGMLMATAAIAFASMMADAADEHEHLFGARREGLYFAGWAFAGKAASGVGALIAGFALQLIGFPSGDAAANGTPADLPPEVVEWIGAIYGPGAGVLTIAAALVCFRYSLDARRHRIILQELGERRTVRLPHAVRILDAK